MPAGCRRRPGGRPVGDLLTAGWGQGRRCFGVRLHPYGTHRPTAGRRSLGWWGQNGGVSDRDPDQSSLPGQEPRQRWRLVIRRRADADQVAQAEWQASWEGALARSGLPIAWTSTKAPKPRFVAALPLPVGLASEGELADLFLVRRLARWQIREALEPTMPAGHEVVDCHDVWLGAPSLPGQVVAAEYLALVPGSSADREQVAIAIAGILAADRIDRRRERGERVIDYDLRPQVLALELAGGGVEAPVPRPSLGEVAIRMRLRHDPERGPGRPEEVVREIGDRVGHELDTTSVVRTRVLLADDPDVAQAVIHLRHSSEPDEPET